MGDAQMSKRAVLNSAFEKEIYKNKQLVCRVSPEYK